MSLRKTQNCKHVLSREKRKGEHQNTKNGHRCGTWFSVVMVTILLLHTQHPQTHPTVPLQELPILACTSARCCGKWYHGSVRGICCRSKFSPESIGHSYRGSGSDVWAPGYPCSGRGNVCDYLLCKPPSWRRKKRGGGMDGKDGFDCNDVCLSSGRRGYVHAALCMSSVFW